MSARMLLIGAAAFIGIVAPFLVARRILNLTYAPDINGAPLPTAPAIVAYVIALAIATVVFFLAARAMRRDTTPPSPDEPIEVDELPE